VTKTHPTRRPTHFEQIPVALVKRLLGRRIQALPLDPPAGGDLRAARPRTTPARVIVKPGRSKAG